MKKDDTSLLKYYRAGKAIVYILLFLLILALFVFHHPDLSLEQKENSRRIGASYMTMNNEFFKIINEQIRDRVEAEGDMMYLRDPALNAERQKEQIENLLDMGITALILNPVDPDGLDEVLQRARKQGVYVVVVDSAVNNDLIQCTIMSDNYDAGCLDAEYMLKTQRSGEIVVMTHERTDSAKQRVRGFLDTISGNSAFTVKGMVECEGQFEIALPEMRKYIEEGNEFDTVFCLNDPAAEGVVAALQEKGLAGKVNVYGVDASPDAKALINAGQMKASAVQFPTKLGETAADVLYRMIDGEEVDETIIVPVDIVTQDNIWKYDNERWQ